MVLEEKLKICKVGWQAEDPGKANVTFQVQRLSVGRIISCSGNGQPFVLFITATDWMRPTHVMENHLLYTV